MIYTVDELAEALYKNPETIRRWCRTGKVNCVLNSRKEGYFIKGTIRNGKIFKTTEEASEHERKDLEFQIRRKVDETLKTSLDEDLERLIDFMENGLGK